ncbi:MAG: hypothetical protein AAGB46_12145, partial [Verrucomicrobiota bacterium]
LITAYLYSYYSSPHYLAAFGNSLLAIFALFVSGLSLHLLAEVKALREALQRILLNRVTFGGAAALITLLAGYAYFVRPYIEPFSQFEDDHYGTRDYRENSLVDLTSYLSAPIIFVAIAGVLLTVRRMILRRESIWLVIFAPWLVFSLLYLYSPQISPDHIWRIRRFTPIVIPGFIFFAFVFFHWILMKVKHAEFRAIATTFLVLFLGAFLFRSTKLVNSTQQYLGTVETVRQIAAEIPDGAIVYSRASNRIAGSIQIAEGKQIVREKPYYDYSFSKIKELAEKVIADGIPFYTLTSVPIFPETYPSPTKEWQLEYSKIKASNIAPATEAIVDTHKFYLTKVIGGLRPFAGSEKSIQIGNSFIFGTTESGFHDAELSGGKYIRWTNGNAQIKLPEAEGFKWVECSLNIASSHPEGTEVIIKINGESVFTEFVPHGGGVFSIPVQNERDLPSTVEIVSTPWRPSDLNSNSSDDRELGIRIRAIEFISRSNLLERKLAMLSSTQNSIQDDQQVHLLNVGIRDNSLIEESGFHDTETHGESSLRWTNGHATLKVPRVSGFTPKAILLSIAATRPGGSNVSLSFNGTTVFQELVPDSGGVFRIPITREPSMQRFDLLEIESEKWIPSQIFSEQEDDRTLGLNLLGISLLRDAEPTLTGKIFDGEIGPYLQAEGLYSFEYDQVDKFSWTNGQAVFQFLRPEADNRRRLTITFAHPGKAQGPITVIWNGRKIKEAEITMGMNEISVDIPQDLDHRKVTLEIQNFPFIPSETIAESTDNRKLGVCLYEIELR